MSAADSLRMLAILEDDALDMQIFHIPHAHIDIPYDNGYLMELNAEILKLTDWATNLIFNVDGVEKVEAHFSRIFCDVERFTDDQKEPMSALGRGVCYLKTDEGEKLRMLNDVQKGMVIQRYYKKHHDQLTELVQQKLNYHGKVFIFDCHSFNEIPLKTDLIQDTNRPDINIGYDEFHTPTKLLDYVVDFFKENGFSVKINEPYSGTIVPDIFYQKNKEVHSLMIEINKKLYMKDNMIFADKIIDLQQLIKKLCRGVDTF